MNETDNGKCFIILKEGDDFDNKDYCMYVIGKKALDEGFEFKARKSDTLRNKALEINLGCPIESFSQFPYYFYDLKMANEGTVTHIETDDEGRFKICFVAFGFTIRSFLTHMRPLLITDGAHLKGFYKGTDLVLVGMDGNNQYNTPCFGSLTSSINSQCIFRSGSFPRNTIANPKGELKAITTRSGSVLDGPFVPIPPPFINPEEDKRIEETLTDQDLAEYTFKVPPPLKMLKALLSNKEKLQELANIPLNENCSACKALADLGASVNLMQLSVWKKLGLPKLISTRMTLKLANQAICTPPGIARDVFVPVGKFTFPSNFVIVDYESDPRVPLILGRPFLWTARALIDVHGEEMILRDGDERLTLNMRHDTSSYSNKPQKESINLINVFNDSKGSNFLPEKLLDLDSTKDLHPPLHVNPLSRSTTYSSSPNQLLEEFADEFTLITFPLGNDDLQFDIESDLKEVDYLLHHDPIKDIDYILKDSIAQINLTNIDDNLGDTMPEMFTDEHPLDYSSPSLFDEYDDDIFKVESDTENVYDDPFDSKGEKIKESKLLINELDLPCDFLFPFEYDSFISEDFYRVDALPSTNNEDKVFNPGIQIQENLFEIITRIVQDKKLAISHASLMIEDFDPPIYELPFFRKVSMPKMLLLFSSENEEKNFKPGIHTSGKVHSSLITELSHQGYKVFKINQNLKSLMKNFLFSCGKDTHILDVPCPYFYPP
nr:hypothetical protein [Tanacetum cinerariifolium]